EVSVPLPPKGVEATQVQTGPPSAANPPAAPTVHVPTYTAPPQPGGGGSALKIIFIILGIFIFLGLLGMGSCAYLAYRAKQKINAMAGDMKTRPYHGKKDPCALASMTEVGNALGQPVTEMQPAGSSACIYHFGNNQQIA